MNKVVESSWQSWLIALGLLIMIPSTVWLGMDFMAPKVNWKEYSKLRSQHFKECRQGRDENNIDYEKCDMDWHASDVHKQHAAQMKSHLKFQVLVSGPLVLGLMVASSFISSAVIAAAFVASGVMVHAFYGVTGHPLEHEAMVMILQFVMALLSLGIVICAAYRD